jgi:2-keto-4-pentenoate hydratase
MTGAIAATDLISACAARLADAELNRRPMEPITALFPGLSVSDAYRIQRANIERRTQQGERIVGHKVGLTSRAMQELFGVKEPDFGHLLESMVHDPRRPLDLATLIDPQIEVEPAFYLERRLAGPGVTAADALAATGFVSLCFEIIDSRIIDWRIRIQDTVADNGSSARLVLCPQKLRPATLELGKLEATLSLDGVEVASGNTAAILGHPANGVAWLANKLAEFGLALEPGEIVLPGTCMRSCRLAGHRSATGRIAGLGELVLELANRPAVVKADQS